jgi:hypothetical protein
MTHEWDDQLIVEFDDGTRHAVSRYNGHYYVLRDLSSGLEGHQQWQGILTCLESTGGLMGAGQIKYSMPEEVVDRTDLVGMHFLLVDAPRYFHNINIYSQIITELRNNKAQRPAIIFKYNGYYVTSRPVKKVLDKNALAAEAIKSEKITVKTHGGTLWELTRSGHDVWVISKRGSAEFFPVVCVGNIMPRDMNNADAGFHIQGASTALDTVFKVKNFKELNIFFDKHNTGNGRAWLQYAQSVYDDKARDVLQNTGKIASIE